MHERLANQRTTRRHTILWQGIGNHVSFLLLEFATTATTTTTTHQVRQWTERLTSSTRQPDDQCAPSWVLLSLLARPRLLQTRDRVCLVFRGQRANNTGTRFQHLNIPSTHVLPDRLTRPSATSLRPQSRPSKRSGPDSVLYAGGRGAGMKMVSESGATSLYNRDATEFMCMWVAFSTSV